jgi:hypothetical protein
LERHRTRARARVNVSLLDEEDAALAKFARSERRTIAGAAALCVRRELERAGLLVPEGAKQERAA